MCFDYTVALTVYCCCPAGRWTSAPVQTPLRPLTVFFFLTKIALCLAPVIFPLALTSFPVYAKGTPLSFTVGLVLLLLLLFCLFFTTQCFSRWTRTFSPICSRDPFKWLVANCKRGSCHGFLPYTCIFFPFLDDWTVFCEMSRARDTT